MKNMHRHLYFWVLVAILLGGALGFINPTLGAQLKPLADGFIALIKMLIGPVVFCTVVIGISGAGDIKKVGRVGVKSLLYFEVISTFALILGLLVANIFKPGRGFNVDPRTLDANQVTEFSKKASEQSVTDFFLHLIPKTFLDAFTSSGDLMQILIVAILFGYALNHIGEKGRVLHGVIDSASQVFFKMVGVVMLLAPVGAGASMAFTVGKYGVGALKPLFGLMLCFYLTCALFILIVLGVVARICGFSILRFVRYIRSELLLVLGTSSSESALVSLMEKLEKAGCPKAIVGLVIPAGYSFNLDGTNIYLTLATLFVAQALNIELTLVQQLSILAVAVVTSKGASGVTGAGFITLAATLAVVPDVPVAGLALILGVDRFMSEARALTNIVGNGVAAIVVSRWEGELDTTKLKLQLK